MSPSICWQPCIFWSSVLQYQHPIIWCDQENVTNRNQTVTHHRSHTSCFWLVTCTPGYLTSHLKTEKRINLCADLCIVSSVRGKMFCEICNAPPERGIHHEGSVNTFNVGCGTQTLLSLCRPEDSSLAPIDQLVQAAWIWAGGPELKSPSHNFLVSDKLL